MSDEEQFEFDVFVSYSSKDKDWVRGELLQGLEKAGLRVFIDYRDFDRGAPSIKECERGVLTSRKTLLILTPNYVGSGWGELENVMVQTLDPANAKRRLIPLLKSACQKPLRIATLTHIDFTDDADQQLAWKQLLATLGSRADPPPQPQSAAGKRWQYVNLTLATVLTVFATLWSYRVWGVFSVSIIWAGISAVGLSGLAAFFFPKLGFRDRLRQILRLLRSRGTAVAMGMVCVAAGMMSCTGTTINVTSLPQGMNEIQIDWGPDNQTSQDTLSLNRPKWFWTFMKSTPVRFVEPGFSPVTRSVTPWSQTVFHGRNELTHQPFVVVQIGKPIPPSIPGRNADAGFQWTLRVTIRSVANPAKPADIWQPDKTYYVGDPLWLGGDGSEWPSRQETPAGIESEEIFKPTTRPCFLTAENDYTIELLDQHGDSRYQLELSHEEVARIRRPELREFPRQ